MEYTSRLFNDFSGITDESEKALEKELFRKDIGISFLMIC
nr:hypothetical protein [Photobacterium leiognathi]